MMVQARVVLCAACAAALALALPACKGEQPAPTTRTKAARRPAPASPATTSQPASPKPKPKPKPALPARGTTKLEAKVKVTRAGLLPLRKALHPWRALAGHPVVPAWAIKGGDPRPARDGDLLTAWRCTAADDKVPCAVGVALGQKATIHALRLFFTGAAPRAVRVHTDSGWVEARIKRADRYQHVLFDPPLETTGLALEASASGSVALAELEIFGSGGAARPPLQLDPLAAVTVTDKGRFWTSAGKATVAWVEIVDGKGQRRRLLRGTEVIGAKADRFIIVRSLVDVDCACESGGPEQRYTYALVDRDSRLFYAMTKLTGPDLYIAKKGTRYTTHRSHYCEFNSMSYYDAVRIDSSGKVRWKRWRTTRDTKLRGFARYAPPADAGVGTCPTLKSRALRSLLRRFSSRCVTAGKWVVFLGAGGCAPRYSVAATINRETGDVGEQRRCKGRFVPVRARKLPGGAVLVQVPRKQGDAADLHSVGDDGKFQRVYANTFLDVPTTPGGEMCIGMGCM